MVLGSFIDPTGHWDQVSKPDQNRLLKRHIWHTCGIDRRQTPFFSLELTFYYFPVTQEIPFNFSMVNFSSSF